MKIDNLDLFDGVYKNKKILITGDTGFKGSWLSIWLKFLEADIFGYALPPKSTNDNYVKTSLFNYINHTDGDIRDLNSLKDYFIKVQPDIAFHLAAQPIVLESYKNPHYTFETNIMGTANFLECVKATKSIKAAVVITSDKCYQNNESIWGYKENDKMGGDDPYSASKGCSELIISSYLKSFFSTGSICKIASARAGNVIGGGDWADNRIVPDFFRAIENNEKIILRNPESTRPWQHVLEPLSGYLLLGSKLYLKGSHFCGGWNFGPLESEHRTVLELINMMINISGKGSFELEGKMERPHEAGLLKLDISKSVHYLKWKPVLNFCETVKFTVDGYRNNSGSKNLYEERIEQIRQYVSFAKVRNISWAVDQV